MNANHLLQKLNQKDLPDSWWKRRTITQQIGDAWLEKRQHLGLLVPSVVVPIARNCLLNPLVPAVAALKLEVMGRFPLDHRLLHRDPGNE